MHKYAKVPYEIFDVDINVTRRLYFCMPELTTPRPNRNMKRKGFFLEPIVQKFMYETSKDETLVYIWTYQRPK